MSSPSRPILQRIDGLVREPVVFELDGRACTGFDGDTVLTAVLTQSDRLRASDALAEPRAGFCLMGACQDCWVLLATGERLRACSTLLQAGMRIVTGLPR